MFNGIRVFDTILNSRNTKDTVSRNSADFWKVYCQASGWQFSHERLHSLADFKYFMSRKIKEDVIIFSGHGSDGKEAEEGFHFSNGDVFFGQEDVKIHAKNHGKIVIFSSCLIGKNKVLSEALKDSFNAKALFAYKHLMLDKYCFLNESILLSAIEHQFERGKSFTKNTFNGFLSNTEFLKNMNEKGVRTHPMAMY